MASRGASRNAAGTVTKKRRPPPRQSIVAPAQRTELDALIQQVFCLADSNQSGGIQFGEFLAHHEKFMDATTALPSADYQETETNFRKLDKDQSGCLSEEEFASYMESLLAVLGSRNFRQTCQDFISKEQQRKCAQDGDYDWRFTTRLLEQARLTNYYLSEIQESALSFIEQKADPNFTDETGSHCLLYAAGKSCAKFVARLLECRADPTLHNKAYECAAFRAAHFRSLDALGVLLLSNAPEEPETEDQEQASRDLVRNMSSLSEAGIQKLLAKRADINFKDESGWTPLTAAVFFGEATRVEVLLRTLNAFSTSGRFVPGTQAQGRVKKLRVDLHNGRGRAPLHIAARKGHAALVMPLVRARGSVDCQDIDGWTPLHHAAFNGMGEVADMLLEAGADLLIQGRNGLTPWQVSKLPIAAGALGEHTMKKMQPPAAVDFSKVILPLLKDDSLTLDDKLTRLLSLPGVCQQVRNLRLHEQCFDSRHGPNRVRLRKLWELLALPIVKRLIPGTTDLADPKPTMSEDEAHDVRLEIVTRRKEQQAFVSEWLKATRGMRNDADWRHENRLDYGREMQEAMKAELEGSAKELELLYQAMLELEGGRELAQLPCEEVLRPEYPSQLAVHPIPLWAEQLNPAGAFEALRLVGACGMGKDDDDALIAFKELVTLQHDFVTGPGFWKNAYRLWLSEYAKVADVEFHKMVHRIVDKFNTLYAHDSEMACAYRPGPAKTYQRMKVKERQFGENTHVDYRGRTLASKILDVIRGTIEVNSPSAALVLLNDFFRTLDESRSRLKLVRIENSFNKDARTVHGFRNLVLNLVFDGGPMASRCGRPGCSMHVALMGEVQVNLESFAEVQKRREIIYDCSRGVYDWAPEDACAEGDAPDTARSNGLQVDDDLPLSGKPS